MEFFQVFLSSEELDDALKQFLSTNSFDPDGIHIQMMKKLDNYARTFFLEIFNNCRDEAVWSWTQSRVPFIRKPKKAKYDNCSS